MSNKKRKIEISIKEWKQAIRRTNESETQLMAKEFYEKMRVEINEALSRDK